MVETSNTFETPAARDQGNTVPSSSSVEERHQEEFGTMTEQGNVPSPPLLFSQQELDGLLHRGVQKMRRFLFFTNL